MKRRKIISFLVAFIFTLTSVFFPSVSVLATQADPPVFSDIKGHWAEETILRHSQKGMLKGYPDGTFQPDQRMIRAELITLMNRYFGLTNGAADNFQDVSDSAWYADETAKARYYGYIEALKAEPNMLATREAVVQMLSMIVDLEEQAHVKTVPEFRDLEKTEADNKKNILQFAQMGYLKGYEDGTFRPTEAINRAEIMTLAEAVLGYIVQSQEDLDHIPAGVQKITIIKSGLTIVNKTINADLYITPGVNGSVTIQNSTVKGKIEISGGSKDQPIILDHVQADKVILTKTKGSPTIEMTASKIKALKVKSETTVKTDDKTTIDTATVQSSCTMTGDGTIKKAYVNAKDVVMEKRPAYVEVMGKDMTLKVAGKNMVQETDDRHATSTGSWTSRKIPVTGVSITGSAVVGSTLTATVRPTDASAGFQWQRETTADVFENISGAVMQAYVLTAQDENHKIRVIATGTLSYVGTVISNELGPVETNDPVALKIKQGFIPVANQEELHQIALSTPNTFGLGTKYQNTYTGGMEQKYIQVADIDLTGHNFIPIGYNESADTAVEFTGTYEGNGHTISNLQIDRNKELQGFFSKLGTGARISGMTISGATLKTSSRTGAFAGEANGATIENSKIKNISFDFYSDKQIEFIGGFVGKAANTSFQSSELDSFTMLGIDITDFYQPRMYVGGVVGLLNGGELKDTHVKNMRIDAASQVCEGLGFKMARCGGMVGVLQNAGVNPMLIDGCSASNVNITFLGCNLEQYGGLIGLIESAPGDGDYTIRNCTASGEINGKSGDGVSYVGGFIGYIFGKNTPKNYVLLENCNTSVDIKELSVNPSSADISASHGTGGFAAHLNGTKLINCSASGNLDSDYLCGAAGFSAYIDDSTLERCYATGNVLGFMCCAGFAANIQNSSVSQCYATGRVGKSTKQDIPCYLFSSGGFAMTISAGSEISDCYYSGQIGDDDSMYVGGFAYNLFGKIKNVYVSGPVRGATEIYTFVKGNGCTALSGAYWNTSENPSGIAVEGGSNDGITGISEEQFKQKATFAGWDISDVSEGRNTIWKIRENGAYPYLMESSGGIH